MIYLLDTSVWLRSVMEPETVPPRIRQLLSPNNETFGLSAMSLWEVGKKHQIGKLHFSIELLPWLRNAVAAHIEILPLTPEIIADAMRMLNFPNRDPADELIVATARVHGLTLLTTDTSLKGYAHAKIHYFKPIGL